MRRPLGYACLAAAGAGLALLVWAGGYFAWQAYTLTTFGQESRADVVGLDHVTGGRGRRYSYVLQIDGQQGVFEFAHPLPVGSTISVLRYRDSISVGTSESTALQIYATVAGGPVLAALFAAALLLAVVAGPKAVLEIVRRRERFLSTFERR
jgi:hypothetical protein